jgi:3-oxoacyl-[acyl-carrier-protein] synthase-3
MATIQNPTGSPYAAVLGVGSYRPERLVPNAEVVDAIDSSDEWIQQRSGIKTRRWAGPEESVQMMSVSAARKALEHAGIDARQIDCVVVATVSHMLQTPAIATAIAHELGTDQAAAFDISAACAGFCHGLSMASDFVRAGSARHVLVIGVERLTDILDLTDRGTAFIFADGAGAVVVGPSDNPGIGPVVWGSDGEQFDLIRQREDWRDVIASGEPEMPHLVMQGNSVFRWASFAMAKIAQQALDRAGVAIEDLDVFVPHQANMRIIDALDEAARAGEDRPRRRRHGQHLGGLRPPRPGPHGPGGRGALRGHRAPRGVRCRPGVRRPGHHRPLARPPSAPPGAVTTPERNTTQMATTEEIRADLADIVNEVAGIDTDDVQLDKSFVDDLDVDSLSMVEVVVAAEEKFGVSIPDDEVKNLKTVGDAVAFIERASA